MEIPYWIQEQLTRMARALWGGKKRSAFYRRLAVYLNNGIPVRAATTRLLQQKSLQGGSGLMAAFDPDRLALQEIGDRLANGETLSQALRGWAPTADLSIIQAGELSGDLASGLRSAIEGQGIIGRMMGKIVGEAIDPMVMSGLGVYLVYIVGTKMVPPMELMSNPNTWPTLARALLPMAAAAQSPWSAVFFLLMIVGLVSTVVSLPFWSQHGRRYVENIPPWSIYRMIIGAQWMIGFSRLVGSGITATDALGLQAKYARPWLRDRLLDAQQRMRNGRELGQAFIEGEMGFPDRILADDLSAFSGSGDFAKLLRSLGEEWLEDIERKVMGTVRMMALFANIGVNLLILLVVFGVFDLQNVMMASAHTG